MTFGSSPVRVSGSIVEPGVTLYQLAGERFPAISIRGALKGHYHR